jgi:hypothetical protein
MGIHSHQKVLISAVGITLGPEQGAPGGRFYSSWQQGFVAFAVSDEVVLGNKSYWFFPEAYHNSAQDLQRTSFTMTSIDDLFRKPNAPGKRKLESPSSLDPNELYNKSAKLSNGSSARINGRASTVEDEIDLDDVDAGPSLPPEDDVPDDKEGRFFGGGITSEEKEVLDFIDAREGEEVEGAEVIDVAWLRKIALNFEKRASKNAEMRAKFEGSPERCVRLSRPTLF